MSPDRRFLRAAILLSMASLNLAAQTPVERARIVAQRALQDPTKDSRSFTILRREDIEQVFQSVRLFSNSQAQSDIVVFEIRERGSQVKNNSVSYFFNVHGDDRRILAVMIGSDEVFRISGFKDAQQEFNRLAGVYKVKLSTEFQAGEYARLYLQLDPANYRLSETSTFLLLKQLAERKFAERDGDFLLQGGPQTDDKYKKYLTGEAKFEEWWGKNRESLAHLPFAEETTRSQSGFDTKLMTLSDLDARNLEYGPVPMRVTVRFSLSGQATEPTFTPLSIPAKLSRVQ